MLEHPLRIRFIADAEFAEALRAAAAQAPSELEVVVKPADKDVTRLGLDLATTVQIVTILKGMADLATFAAKVYQWWRDESKKKNKSRTVILQTPHKTLELRTDSDVTEADIHAFLKAAVALVD